MKISLLRASLLYALLSSGCTIPVLAAPTSGASASDQPAKVHLPEEVSAEMAPGAISLQLVRLPFGTGSAPILLHTWTVKRRSYQENLDNTKPIIVCLDLFSGSEKKWKLAVSTCYMTRQLGIQDIDRLTYEARWLHPATKQGVVIREFELGPLGSGSVDTLIRLITLPKGINSETHYEPKSLSVQEFGGQSGNIYTQFALDANGTTIIEKEIVPKTLAPSILRTYAWLDGSWTQVSSKETP